MKNSKSSNTRGPREGSVVDQLLKLGEGETFARTRLVEGEDAHAGDITYIKRTLAGQATKDTARARAVDAKAKFSVDTGITITSSNAIYATVIITRTK